MNLCRVARNFDFRAHSGQFGGVHKTIFENRFRHGRNAFGLRHQSHILRLHIGREIRMRLGRHVFSGQTVCRTFDKQRRRIQFFDFDSGFAHFRNNGDEMIGTTIFDFDFAVRNRRRNDKSSGFDAVGDNRMFRAAQSFNAFDFDN